MKVLFLTNNDNTQELIEFIKKTDEVIVFKDKLTLEVVKNYKPEFIVSYNYRFLITQDIIDFMQDRMINLHISLLPWNKGSYPNLWSIIEDTPKGITIHNISSGLDEGAIIVQEEILLDEEVDTLKSSYDKLHQAMRNLFIENWESIKSGKIAFTKQVGDGNKHTTAETKKYLSVIDSWDMPIKEFKQKINQLNT